MRTVIETRRYERSQQCHADGSEQRPALLPHHGHRCARVRMYRRDMSTLRLPLEPLEIRAHIGGALIPQVAILLQRLPNHGSEARRKLRVHLQWRRRLLVENRAADDARA